MDKVGMPSLYDDYLTHEMARQKGVSKYGFYKFIRENELERITRGVYSKDDVLIDDKAVNKPKYHVPYREKGNV